MYEIFEHTADLGLRIRSGELARLFEEAGLALFSVIATDLDSVRPREEVSFQLEADRYDDLLRDWLAELLYTFHARHLLLRHFDVEVRDTLLRATARGETFDESRHRLDAEVKAVTYHGLKVEREAEGWLAEVIVDI